MSASKGEILVTGGAGYIGSHACRALARAGYTPVTVDNLVYGHEWSVKWGPFHKGDLRDSEFLEKVFSRHHFQAVFHFAAFAYVGESVRDPFKYYDNNLLGLIGLLSAMRKFKVDKLVFSSTCATYGIPERVPIEESFPQDPVNPYGRSKLIAEQILRDMTAAEPLKVASLRYFNAAGASPEGEIGEDHDPETHLIPLTLAAAHHGSALTVFGSDYETPDGTCLRDYIHVDDLAAAHVQALPWLEKQTSGAFEAFNLGTGKGFSVLEIIRAAEKVTGKKVSYKIGERRPGDPPALMASGDKARKILGWTPQCSDLETIVETADRWYKKHFGEGK